MGSVNKRVLITGLNSLIGWNLFRKEEPGLEFFGTYRSPHPKLVNRSNCYRIDLDDSNDIESILQKLNPNYIIHGRSICDLDICERFPELAERINVEGTRKLIDKIKKLNRLEKFIFISTDHVFDGKAGNYSDKDIPEPKHVYGRTKRSAEILVEQSGLPFIVIRPGLVLGDSLQGNKGPKDFLLNRLKKKKVTTLFEDEWRTPIQASELVDKVFMLMKSPREGVFHLSGSESINRYNLGQILAKSKGFAGQLICSELRRNDLWAHIRPEKLTLLPSSI